MSLSGRHHLTVLTKDLLRHWEETRQFWQDRKAEDFERDYLKELDPSVRRAVDAMEKLEAIFAKLRRDCE